MKLITSLLILFTYACTFTICRHYKRFTNEELSKTEIKELYRQYLAEHPHKEYTHTSTKGIERIIHFQANVHKILKMRKEMITEKKNWTAGLNSMTDVSDVLLKAMNAHLDVVPIIKTLETSFLQRTERKIKSKALVQTPFLYQYNYTDLFLDARNQGRCGDCWGFTAAAVMEGFYNKLSTTKNKIYLSAKHVTTCSIKNNGCGGGNVYVAFSTFTTGGIVPESTMPFDLRKYGERAGPRCVLPSSNSGAFANKDYIGCMISGGNILTRSNGIWTSIIGATCPDSGLYDLLKNGPVAVSIDGTVIQHYTGGVFDSPCTNKNHAVTAVGYGSDPVTGLEYWIIRNSWSPTFGEHGYIRIKRDFANNNSCFVGSDYWQPTF